MHIQTQQQGVKVILRGCYYSAYLEHFPKSLYAALWGWLALFILNATRWLLPGAKKPPGELKLLHSVPHIILFTSFTKHLQQQHAQSTPHGSTVSKHIQTEQEWEEQEMWGKWRWEEKTTRATEEREPSVSLISHGALLPSTVMVVVVLTDEAWLWLTCDGLSPRSWTLLPPSSANNSHTLHPSS